MKATKNILILVILLVGVILIIGPCNGYKSPSLVFSENSNSLSQSYLVKSNINSYQSINDNKINNFTGSTIQKIFSVNTPSDKSTNANIFSAAIKSTEITFPINRNEYNYNVAQNIISPQKSVTITDDILRAYEKNLTRNQLKLSTSLLILTDPNHPINLYGSSEQKRGTYGALVKTGIIIPSSQTGLNGPNPRDLILISIYLYPGSSVNSINEYLYQKDGYDAFYNSIVAWVYLDDIAKIAANKDVRMIDTPVAAINYHDINKE
jgi:hypothetical protein